MDRIEDVDLREALGEIAVNNTFFHRDNDLNISLEQIERAAKMYSCSEKSLIWVSYPSGIDCYPEREVFQKDTRGYNGVLYHGFDMPDDRKLAYAVSITDTSDGSVRGSLTELDIREYAAKVRGNAVPSNSIRIYLDDPNGGGKQMTMPKYEFDRRDPRDLPKMAGWRHEPDDPAALSAAIKDTWNNRRGENTKTCSLWSHTSKLYDGRTAFYAGQILRGLNGLREPNGADRQSFSTPLNAYVAAAFNTDQLGRLLDALPYQNAEFSLKKGQQNMCAVVSRDEIMAQRHQERGGPTVSRDGREIPVTVPPNEKRGRAVKPSLMKTLEANEAKSRQQFSQSAPKKTAQKAKGEAL